MDSTHDAVTLRARLDHHTGVKARAEAERAGLIADRADLGSLLNESELDEIDAAIARAGDTIERASTRIEILRPAVERADRAEAEAAELRNSAALAEQDRATLSAPASANPAADAAAVMAIRTARAPVAGVNQKLFDEPPPLKVTRDDASWWAARDAREREERAARIAALSGQPAPAPERRYPSYAGLANR